MGHWIDLEIEHYKQTEKCDEAHRDKNQIHLLNWIVSRIHPRLT